MDFYRDLKDSKTDFIFVKNVDDLFGDPQKAMYFWAPIKENQVIKGVIGL
jgi:hypothetical protein